MHKLIKWVIEKENTGWDLSLERIEKATKLLDNPQLKYKTIHIAGSNGKGSTAAFLSQILIESGKKVGLYTSPHLVKLNERYKVNGKDIDDDALIDYIERIKALNIELSGFEIMTTIAFLYFKDQKVDYAIIEVGLGGQFDATNVIKPIATAITNISLEHTQWLGKTIEAISGEKAGIIKKDIPLYTAENNQIIKKSAQQNNAPYHLCPPTKYPISLNGEYQKNNASIAIEIAKQLEIKETTIKKGLINTEWPARLQYVEKNILLDSAHNPEAMEFLKEYIDSLSYKNLTIIFSCLEDKDYKKMIKDIPKNNRLIITKLSSPRAIDPEILLELLPKADYIEKPLDAYKKAKAQLKDTDLLLICGSIYLSGEILGE